MSAYYTVAPLVVYLWVVPYVLISVGAVRLALRDKRARIGLIAAALIGGAGMAWAYIDGLINPPPAPADAMSWVVVVVIVLLLAAAGFIYFSSRAGPHAGSSSTTCIWSSRPERSWWWSGPPAAVNRCCSI